MTNLPEGWKEKDGKLVALFKCSDFKAALTLLNDIGTVAELHQHHPDIGIQNYNEVHISVFTHSKNSLTNKDYELAEAISKLQLN